MKENRIAITGSSGFIGSWLSLFLPESKKFDLKNGKNIRKGNVRDEICKDTDCIIHLAAISGIQDCKERSEEAWITNKHATCLLAKQAKQSGVKTFVFASTSAVYGETSEYTIDESHPLSPNSLYGMTKLEAESILDMANKNFTVIILRKSNVYGYGVYWKEKIVINKFIELFLEEKPFQITGNGAQKRDFVHLQDVTNLYLQIAEGEGRSGIYNVGGNESISIRELAELVNRIGKSIFKYHVKMNYTDDFGPSQHDFIYDHSKSQMEFNYQPIFELKDYISERFFLEMRKKASK